MICQRHRVPGAAACRKAASMKLFTLLLACIAVALPAQAQSGRDIRVIAHRGCWEGGAPEVSVSAIRACEAIRPDIIEIDVRQTRDGALILMHDSHVDRTTGGTGAVAEMTAADIRALRLRAGAGGPDAPLTDEAVPTLEEGLLAARGRFITHLHLYTAAEAEVAAIVKKLGMAGQVTTWVSGRPDSSALVHSPLRQMIGLIPIIGECRQPPAPGCWPAPVRSLEGYAPLQPVSFYIIPREPLATDSARNFLQDAAAAPRPAGSRIMASSLFHLDQLPLPALQAEWRKLIALGADTIMTDRPGELIQLLRAEYGRNSTGNR